MKKCVEVELCPASSPVPVLANKRGGQITLSFAEWPRFATSVDVLQDGALVHSFALFALPSSGGVSGLSGGVSGGSGTLSGGSGAHTWTATELEDFKTYSFELLAKNTYCAAPPSAPEVVTMTSDALVLAWEKPAPNQDVRGPLALVGNVTSAIGLAAQNPVQMLLGGSVLDGTAPFGDPDASGKSVYVNRFDPLGADFEGDMTFRLLARDALGLAAFADVLVHAALSLAKLTRYEQNVWIEPRGKTWGKFALTPLLDKREPGGWIDVFVTSPGKGQSLPYDDFAAMETELQEWKNVPFDAPIMILADKASGAPNRFETVLRFSPAQLETRFALNATRVLRTRRIPVTPPSSSASSGPTGTKTAPISDAKLEVLTLDPARVLEITPEGVSVVFDIEARGLTGVLDARRWRDDKVVVVTASGVRVCDIDGAQADFDVRLSFKSGQTWASETRPCVGVEVTDAGAFILIFADGSGSRVWKCDGLNPTLHLDTSEQIVFARAQGDALALVTASHKVLKGDGTLVFAHDAPLTELLFDEANALAGFCDGARVYALTGGAASLVGEITKGEFGALSLYAGNDTSARVVAGGRGGGLWRRESGGAFLPFWTVGHHARRVAGLGRFIQTYVTAKGDPLNGGTPGVVDEVAVALVETDTPQGSFVAFVEVSRQTSDTSTHARGVQRLVVMPA